ncbi:MAG: hypothetical protein H7835_06850 [Magnetococcus sp. XQGC-1]
MDCLLRQGGVEGDGGRVEGIGTGEGIALTVHHHQVMNPASAEIFQDALQQQGIADHNLGFHGMDGMVGQDGGCDRGQGHSQLPTVPLDFHEEMFPFTDRVDHPKQNKHQQRQHGGAEGEFQSDGSSNG